MKTKLFALILTTALILLSIASLSFGAASLAADSPASGSLTGEVKFQGAPPKATRIDMSTDPNCLKARTTPATSEDVITGTDGGLANVIVYVAEGLGSQTFQPPEQPAVLEQKGCTYQPHVIALQANEKLSVVNADKTTHNIHPMPANNREWNKTQPPGVPIEESFAREEIAIPVKCNIHPWMHGYIAVFKHPFFAVTDKDGRFEVKNIPPGNYTIKAWHEKLGSQAQRATVQSGQAGKLEFVFKQ
jgi:plastocyanin